MHVVTLFTPDGKFGGPVTVAVNQARGLTERGHDVLLAGGTSGSPQIPRDINGVPAKLYPARQLVPGIGFSGLWAPGLGTFLRNRRADIDVMHVHLTRDFVTLPAARWAMREGIPVVLQCHGQVDASKRLLAKPLDLLWTRPALRRASRIFFLTDKERQRLIDLAGNGLPLERLHNGVPVGPLRARSAVTVSAAAQQAAVPHSSRPTPDRPEVLFLARLHAAKRPKLFAEVAVELLKSGSSANFTIIGPDGGEAGAVDVIIDSLPDHLRGRLRRLPPIPPDHAAARIAEATVYVLPSIDETYPMSVLEAMSVSRPVIVTNTCGLASAINSHRCGILVDESVDQLSSAITDMLADRVHAREMGERGRHAAENEFGMGSVVDQLESVYRGLSSATRRVRGSR